MVVDYAINVLGIKTDGAADGGKPEAAEDGGEAVLPAVVGVGDTGPQAVVKTTIAMVRARIRRVRNETNGRLETCSAGGIVVRVRPDGRCGSGVNPVDRPQPRVDRLLSSANGRPRTR